MHNDGFEEIARLEELVRSVAVLVRNLGYTSLLISVSEEKGNALAVELLEPLESDKSSLK